VISLEPTWRKCEYPTAKNHRQNITETGFHDMVHIGIAGIGFMGMKRR
jgi:hypothetical protein